MTKAVDLRADVTIREAATNKGDTRIMALASRELVAAEAHYHISCYKRYTWNVKTSADTCPTERSSQDIESSFYEAISFRSPVLCPCPLSQIIF